MNRKFKKIAFLSLFLGFLALSNGCFPERSPVAPEENDTRRPKIAYSVPGDESVVSADTREADIWFDELMEQNTVKENFSISITPDILPWTAIQAVASMDQSRSEPDFIFLGYGTKGILYSENGGNNWKFVDQLTGEHINTIAIDPADSRIIFAASDSSLFRSLNRGIEWNELNNNLPQNMAITTVNFDETDSKYVWLGTSLGIYKSIDGGDNWQGTAELPNWTGQEISKIAVDPQNSSIIYAATLGRYIYKTTDGGNTWLLIRGSMQILPTSRIYDISIDASSSAVLYVATINRGVYKSIDGGDNWREVNNGIEDLNVRQVQIDPSNSLRLFALTSGQIYVSNDSAGTWQNLGIPAGNDVLLKVFINPSGPEQLLLATSGGIYKSFDTGNSWNLANSVEQQSLVVEGSFSFEEWQGELKFVTVEGDTVIAEPYRYGETSLNVSTPFDQNPRATKMIFTIEKSLFPGWNYYLVVRGGFTGDIWRPTVGARDIHGMSLEYDYTALFTVQ